jgi:ferric-dicitrate binding protein FerR (iron transport regulator)
MPQADNLKRRNIVNYKIILFAPAIIALLSSCQKQGAQNQVTPEADAGVSGTVIYVEGKVTLNERQINTGERVPAKSLIVTGPGAECEITFAQKNIIRINENTTVSVDFSQPVKDLDLRQGSIASVLNNLDKLGNADSFSVRTNVAVMGVRGTVIFVHADKDRTYICDCNGTVYLRDADNKNQQTVEAAHHKASVFTKQNGKVVVRPGAMEYHTDEDMQNLAAKIGYTIDWSVIE